MSSNLPAAREARPHVEHAGAAVDWERAFPGIGSFISEMADIIDPAGDPPAPHTIRLYSYREDPSHFGPAHPRYRTSTPNGNCRLCGRPIRYGFEVCADGEEVCAQGGLY